MPRFTAAGKGSLKKLRKLLEREGEPPREQFPVWILLTTAREAARPPCFFTAPEGFHF